MTQPVATPAPSSLRLAVRRWRNYARGAREFVTKRSTRNSWGGPFNGQPHRQRMFLDIVTGAQVVRIVETGTYRGTTTVFMRKATGLPVVTVEAHPQQVGYCRARFLLRTGISLTHGDSRSFLRAQLVPAKARGVQFIYLDAHWGEDLPLADEIAIIRESGCRAVVMVDDFQVPGDAGYGYDDYGPGKRLTLDYLRERDVLPACVFFPSVTATQESGSRRGSVVFTTDAALDSVCRSLASLRELGAAGV